MQIWVRSRAERRRVRQGEERIVVGATRIAVSRRQDPTRARTIYYRSRHHERPLPRHAQTRQEVVHSYDIIQRSDRRRDNRRSPFSPGSEEFFGIQLEGVLDGCHVHVHWMQDSAILSIEGVCWNILAIRENCYLVISAFSACSSRVCNELVTALSNTVVYSYSCSRRPRLFQHKHVPGCSRSPQQSAFEITVKEVRRVIIRTSTSHSKSGRPCILTHRELRYGAYHCTRQLLRMGTSTALA